MARHEPSGLRGIYGTRLLSYCNDFKVASSNGSILLKPLRTAVLFELV